MIWVVKGSWPLNDIDPVDQMIKVIKKQDHLYKKNSMIIAILIIKWMINESEKVWSYGLNCLRLLNDLDQNDQRNQKKYDHMD